MNNYLSSFITLFIGRSAVTYVLTEHSLLYITRLYYTDNTRGCISPLLRAFSLHCIPLYRALRKTIPSFILIRILPSFVQIHHYDRRYLYYVTRGHPHTFLKVRPQYFRILFRSRWHLFFAWFEERRDAISWHYSLSRSVFLSLSRIGAICEWEGFSWFPANINRPRPKQRSEKRRQMALWEDRRLKRSERVSGWKREERKWDEEVRRNSRGRV